MYSERRSTIPGAVAWTRPTTGEEVSIHPDGCLDIIWGDDGALFVAGPDTATHAYRGEPGRLLTGIRFPPGVGPAVIGVPAAEIRDQRVALAAIWTAPAIRVLEDRLLHATNPSRVLEATAVERLALRGGPDPRAVAAARLLAAGWHVEQVADEIGLSERQLLRRSLEWFGYGPKTLARILRLQQALSVTRSGSSYAASAYDAGYADQAHLAREVRAFTGSSLTRLLRGPAV